MVRRGGGGYYGINGVNGSEGVLINAPLLDFSASYLSGEVPFTTNFSILTEIAPQSTYNWDFDNNGTFDSTEPNPSYTYNFPGNYSVKLVLSYNAVSDTILKNNYINVSIPDPPVIATAPDTLRYGNVATNAIVSQDLVIYNWGNSQLEIYSITPANPRYSVSLPNGTTYPLIVEALQSLSISVNFHPLAVQPYNTNLAIITNDPDNGVLIVRLEGSGYLLTSDFLASPIIGDVPLEVSFSDQSVGDILSYAWDFGDGTNSTEQNPIHTYSQEGIYDVSLTISDQYTSRSKIRTDYIEVIAHPLLNTPDNDRIDFGVVYLGDSGIRQLVLQSTGTDTVFVSSVYLASDNGPYSLNPLDFPDYLLPGEGASLAINFIPLQSQTFRDTLYIVNNSENNPVLAIELYGRGEYVPPQEPQGVSIVIDGYDALISWEAVTQNIYNTPISVPYYFIYGSVVPDPDPTQQVFLGYSAGTTFRHLGVGLPGSNVNSPREFFYTVTAVVWYPPRDGGIILDQLIGSSKEELLRKLVIR